jgi:hypothetical protein
VSGLSPSSSWATKTWQAGLVVLAVAVISRLVYELLSPLLPVLAVLLVLVAAGSLAVRGRWR